MLKRIEETKDWLAARTAVRPQTAIILGTGLGNLAREIEVSETFDYADIPHFPLSTVEGHHGRLLFGRLGGRPVVAMEGRFHYYEGYSMQELTFPIRVFAALGVGRLFVSNAAGGMNPDFAIGDIMIIKDHINLMPEHPLRGANIAPGPRFPDMGEAYTPALRRLAREVADEQGISVREGVYLGTQGPTFETPAEYHMFRLCGADAVGMSTVPEVIVAVHCGLEVFGISVITDLGLDGVVAKVSHKEVQAAANAAQSPMSVLFRELIKRLPPEA